MTLGYKLVYRACLPGSRFIKYSLIAERLESFTANFYKKTFVKSKYLASIVTFLATSNAI